jgi:predicted esterase
MKHSFCMIFLAASALWLGSNSAAARTLTPAQVDDARADAWRTWMADSIGSDSLPNLSPLTSSLLPLTFHLPEALEPDADMTFLGGTKGEAEADARLPMLLYLHGSGPREQEWANGLKLALRFTADSPSVYLIPRIPHEGEWYRWWQQGKQWAWEKLLRMALGSGRIDPNRLYLLGISEGGYGSQRLASFYADYFAAAGPMAGGEPLRNAPAENCRNTPFTLHTGELDRGFYRNRLTEITAAAFDSLAAANPGDYVHCVELVAGQGHGFNYDVTTPWLTAYTRNPRPRHITWEDFAMDGRHRRGFGCLEVNSRAATADEENLRTCYDVVFFDQNIDITVTDVTYTVTEIDPIWGIALTFAKSYAPHTGGGEITVYADERYVDLSRPVTIRVNGATRFSGLLPLSTEAMRRSLSLFADPERIFPAAVGLSL